MGGALTESIGWESIFFINVPIGIAAIYISLTRVAESKDPNAGPNDWLGLISFSGGLFLLIFALVRGNAEGWSSTLIVSFLIGAVVLLVAFVVVEARIRYPMLDLSSRCCGRLDGQSRTCGQQNSQSKGEVLQRVCFPTPTSA